MKCRKCGTEIADKALICFRCGAATTDAVYRPPAPRRSSTPLVVSILALALLIIAALFLGRVTTGEVPRYLSWVVVGIAVLIVVLRAVGRRAGRGGTER